jgi:hypothetical protein
MKNNLEEKLQKMQHSRKYYLIILNELNWIRPLPIKTDSFKHIFFSEIIKPRIWFKLKRNKTILHRIQQHKLNLVEPKWFKYRSEEE